MENLAIGAHLVAPRVEFGKHRLYDHHGIYVGENKVIHYSGMAEMLKKGPIQETTLEEFIGVHSCAIERHLNPKYPGVAAVQRAKARLTKSADEKYNLLGNNCEHFVNWCIEGDSVSFQVERVGLVASGPAIGAPVGTALAWYAVPAVAAPTVVGLSGPGLLSGLAWVGGLIGGGAVAGIATIAALPAAIAGYAINSRLLSDRDWHSEQERAAREAARLGTAAGGAAGVAGGVGAIAAFGTVAGLSGPGIASGLAAVGSLLGGGMAAGVAIVAAAPTLTAAAGAYGVYRLAKWYNPDSEDALASSVANDVAKDGPAFPEGDEAAETTAVFAALLLRQSAMSVEDIAATFSNGRKFKKDIALALLNGVRLGCIASADGGETFVAVLQKSSALSDVR
jgi:hypothetical protein